MTVFESRGGGNGSYHASFTGEVRPSDYAGSSLYRPLMLTYLDRRQWPGDWCVNESRLRDGDVADEDQPVYLDLRAPAAPVLVPHYNREWSFPRHTYACLAYDGGEIQRYENWHDGTLSLNGVFSCDNHAQEYVPPYELPFAYAGFSRVTLPAAQDLGDGRLRIAGTVTHLCEAYSGETSRSVTLTVDLIGGPPPEPPPDIIEVAHDLTVEVRGAQYGRVFGAEETIFCGQGLLRCVTRVRGGGTVRLAALTAPAGRFLFWEDCDDPAGLSCIVTLNGPRTVRAWFGYDFVGQWDPPPEGLFDAARKAEIADNGADAARDGAIGCASTAGIL